jgi:hypothetical protein
MTSWRISQLTLIATKYKNFVMSYCHLHWNPQKNDVPNEVPFSCLLTNLKQYCHVKLSLQWSVPNDVSFACLPTNLKRCCHVKLSLQWSVSNDVPKEVSFSCLPTNLKQFCHIKLSLQRRVPNDIPNEGLICMPTYQSKTGSSCQIVHFT